MTSDDLYNYIVWKFIDNSETQAQELIHKKFVFFKNALLFKELIAGSMLLLPGKSLYAGEDFEC